MSEAMETGHEAQPLAPEVAESAAPAAPEPEADEGAIEAEALAMGWKPEDQYRGPKDKFVSAAEYVERGKTIMPFLRKELVRRDREIERLNKAVTQSIQHISRADQRAYAKAKADLEAELERYAEAGDKANVKAVTDDLIALERDNPGAERQAESEGPPPEMQAWLEANEAWYGKDKALTAACEAIAQEVFDDGYVGKAQLKEVDRRLREQFPTKFKAAENPNRRLPGAVEGASGARRTAGKSYSDLPPDAKAMCDDMCREIKGMTRESWVAKYFAREDRK